MYSCACERQHIFFRPRARARAKIFVHAPLAHLLTAGWSALFTDRQLVGYRSIADRRFDSIDLRIPDQLSVGLFQFCQPTVCHEFPSPTVGRQ